MDRRLEGALEQILYILQERQYPIEYGRLLKTLYNRNGDRFYEIDFKINKLKDLGYLHDNEALLQLTSKGDEFKGFGEIKYQEYLEEKERSLSISNLELKNESLNRQSEIDRLTIENLELQNRQLRRYVIYSIVGFMAGAFVSNLNEIIAFIAKL